MFLSLSLSNSGNDKSQFRDLAILGGLCLNSRYLLGTPTRFMLSKFKIIAFRGQKRLDHAQIGLL